MTTSVFNLITTEYIGIAKRIIRLIGTMSQACVEIDVPYHDVDAMSIVWHGHYYKYFEVARSALLRSINYDHLDMVDSGYEWPIIESHCRYYSPLKYGMKVKVSAEIQEYKYRLKIGYCISNVEDNQLLTKGFTIQVAVNIKARQMCYSSPDILLNRLGIMN